MHRFSLMVFAVCFLGCAGQAPCPMNVTLLVDCSSSMSGQQETIRKDMAEAGVWWARQAMGEDGGLFEVLAVGCDIDDVTVLLSVRCPDSFGAPIFESKKKWLNGFKRELRDAGERMPGDGGSALIEGILRASHRLSEVRGEKILVICSDMRQVSRDINFERSMPDRPVVKGWLSNHRLAPALNGVKVLCIGFKPYPPNLKTPKISPEEYAKLREGIAEESGVGKSVIDLSLKEKTRLFRLPNSQHGESKLYKIQLRYDELLKLDVSDIKEKARRPGMLWNTDETGLIPEKPVAVNTRAAGLYETALSEVGRMKSRSSPTDIARAAEYKQRSGKLFCKARQKMWYSQIPEGLRNNCCVRLAAELRLSGIPHSEAQAMMSFWNDHNEIDLPAEELTGIVRNVYGSNRLYDFGCRDEFIAGFCPHRQGRSKCADYREYRRSATGDVLSKENETPG